MRIDKLSELALADTVSWQRHQFQEDVEGVLRQAEHAMRDLQRAAAAEVDLESEYRSSYSDKAAAMAQALIQGLTNAIGTGRLARAAADLDVSEHALRALQRARAAAGPNTDPLEHQDAEYVFEKAKRRQAAEQRQAKQARRCRASVPEGGRAVTFRQCAKQAMPGRNLCRTHADLQDNDVDVRLHKETS